ncbi:MAG: alpha/beta hydrolase [Gammaproteobacteria bacterium]
MPLALIAAAAIACIWVYLSYQHRQVFKPTSVSAPLSPNPGEHDVDFEIVKFDGPGKQPLYGWWLPCSPEASTLIFCHGNRGNLSDRTQSCLLYRRLGLNVFAFDYRGYGRSPGRPTERGLYADAYAAWRYVRDVRGIDAADIALLGRSLGGGVASHLALHTKPAAVIIESTFTSIPDLAREHFRNLPRVGLGRMRFDNVGRVAQISSPLHMFHSTEDAVIGFHHGETLARSANCPLTPIRGAHSGGHIESGTRYTEPLSEFLRSNGLRMTPDS